MVAAVRTGRDRALRRYATELDGLIGPLEVPRAEWERAARTLPASTRSALARAARQIARIATGWRLRAVADPIIVCTHAQTPEAIFAPKVISSDDLSRCEELGAALAAGLAMGIF